MSEAVQNLAEDLKSRLAINDILQVQITDDKDPVTYYSRISDLSETRFAIAWPTNRGIRLLAHPDQMLDFYFVRDGIPNSFSGIVDEIMPDPLPQLTIIVSTPISQVQRRQNFRIKCLVPAEVAGSIREASLGEATVPIAIKTTSYDISASGISICHAKRIPEGTPVSIKLSIPDSGAAIKLPGVAVYSEYMTENRVLYRTGIRFLAITEGERARIVRFVYRKQLEGLRP